MANVNLSQRDIDYIARVVDTEVPRSLERKNPEQYRRMVNAVVDTVTNRVSSGQYPSSVEGVLNQKRQFSKITGPSYLSPYGSVENTPKAPSTVRNLVTNYVADRAQGLPSEIGGSLNYANPNYSSRSNLMGWINPMIERGATALGVGKAIHYHGTVPGQEPAGPYNISAEGIPSGRVATPSSRPPDLESILNAPSPTNSLLNAPVTSVQRASLKEPSTVAAFDNGRFAGPQVNMQTVPELSYDRFSTQPFDAARFGPVTDTGKTMNQVRRSLLDQQLDAGVLPDLTNPAYAAMAPSSATVRAPSTIANAAVQAPQAPMNSLLSPQEEQAVSAQRNYLSSMPLNRPAVNTDRIKGVLGTVGPAIAGGLLGGPLGALVGGFAGKQVFANNILTPPEKKMPAAPKSQSRGDGSLTSYGRSVTHSSGQFSNAVSSGKAGLW